MTMKMKIAVVDNHHLVRYAVSKAITEHSTRFTVSFECTNGLELKKALTASDPQELPRIVLCDLNMPTMDGFETTRWLNKNYPEIKVLILTMTSDEATIIRLIKAGISGYLIKNIDAAELFDALATVDDGGTYFKTFDASIISRSEEKNPAEEIWYNLSERERQFVRLCASDLEDKEVLAKIGIRPNTTEPFAKKIYAKFGVKTRVGLVMLATKHRLFPIDD
jgi:two-component system invasion response regulator UvrY